MGQRSDHEGMNRARTTVHGRVWRDTVGRGRTVIDGVAARCFRRSDAAFNMLKAEGVGLNPR
jgi:hypothetical protein